MKIPKLITYYSVCYLVYKIIKNNLNKYKINIKKVNDDNINNDMDNNINNNKNRNNENGIDENKNKLNYKIDNINEKKYNTDKFNNINKINSSNENNTDNKVINTDKKENNYQIVSILNNNKNKKIKKNIQENNILNIDNENIIFENNIDNYLKFEFDANINCLYKIICDITFNNLLNNIKLIITNSNGNKKFIYDYEKDSNDYDKINKFGFILDNNQFIFNNLENKDKEIKNEKIYIYIFFFENNIKTLINNFSLIIKERELIKSNEAIVIFDINNNKYPLFPNTCNILDYVDFNDECSLIFV